MFTETKKSATYTVAIIAMALVAVAGPMMASAQDNAQDKTDEQIRACGEIEDATKRMDCFDAVVKGLNESSATSGTPSNNANAVPAATTTGIGAGTEAATIPTELSSAPSSSSDTAAAVGATATTGAAEADDFGLEDQKAAEARQKEKEEKGKSGPVSIHSTVVKSEKSGLNHFVVALENGQVWEETDGSRRLGLPRIGTSVEVYEGKFGGYRMKFGTDNRVAWVRRLK
jgi:hypothetical protein